MGMQSYQGAKGGFVFVCPVSGRMKVKLYATTKQYPAILYQVLQEVESEGYAVREIYVDTQLFSINHMEVLNIKEHPKHYGAGL